MTIDLTTNWNEAAIKALIDRLYVVGRRCQAVGRDKVAFVLPSRNKEARQKLETEIIRHFALTYGASLGGIDPLHSGEEETIIHFPNRNVTLILMDV